MEWKSFFKIKDPFFNFFILINATFIAGIFKIGMLANEEIIAGDIFRVWIFAIICLILIDLVIIGFFKSEGFFMISNFIVMIWMVTPLNKNLFILNMPLIAISISLIGIVIQNYLKLKGQMLRFNLGRKA